MSINARCGSCNRELLLAAGPVQRRLPLSVLRVRVRAWLRHRRPWRGRRVMAAQAVLVTALAELGSMTGDRLRLDRATVVDPVANTLPEVKAKQPALARRRHAHWWARGAAPQPTQPPRTAGSSS